jgi:hypothetical protein
MIDCGVSLAIMGNLPDRIELVPSIPLITLVWGGAYEQPVRTDCYGPAKAAFPSTMLAKKVAVDGR